MKYAAAYLLASHGGHVIPKKADIIDILKASSSHVDEARVDNLLEHVGHKHLNDIVNLGLYKMSQMTLAVGGVAASASAAPAAEAAKAEEKVEEKQEEKKEEKKVEEEEEEMDMGGLFDF